MKIGIFDSGLGGLLITKSLTESLPGYDYLFLGDTKRVPYGNRSHDTIYEFLEEGIGYLFDHGCALTIVACNTASAHALRKIQREYLPSRHPDRRVLGVIIPTCEDALADPSARRIGVLATSASVGSGTFVRELKKLNPQVEVIQQEAPLLVPFIENDALHLIAPILEEYLLPFRGTVDSLILGCTHYPILKEKIAQLLGPDIRIVSQDECVPEKLADYLSRHPEIERRLGKTGGRRIAVTDLTKTMSCTVRSWFGSGLEPELIVL